LSNYLFFKSNKIIFYKIILNTFSKSIHRNSLFTYNKSLTTKQLLLNPKNNTNYLNGPFNKKFFLKKPNQKAILPIFKLYMQVNYTTNFLTTKTHTSASENLFSFSKKGLLATNISKIFQKWKNFYYLMFNLYFYKIKILTFGTTFFIKEIQSLNWKSSSIIKTMWRYTHIFLFFTQNKLEVIGVTLFKHLQYSGYNSALLLDIIYHKYTLNYLTKLNYYTIGVVASTTNHKLVDVAIPISTDSLFLQLFFLRTALKIRQQALSNFYQTIKDIKPFL